MRVLAVVNQKGGSGKTTTAVNLAAGLAERDRRVLVVDLDPQASASSWLGAGDCGRGLWNMFTGAAPLAELIRATGTDGVAVAPASQWLVGADKMLATAADAETRLRRQLEALPAGAWDYVLLDCPPTLGILTVNALTAAREVLITVEAHVLPLAGLVQLLKTVEVVRERLNPDLRVSGILACRVDARTRHAREVVEQLRKRFGDLVHQVMIRENIRLAECPSFGQPITRYANRSAGAEDYRRLAGEIIAQEGSS